MTLAASFPPYILPFSLTIQEAAAPLSSLEFLFWGAGLFVPSLTLAYTIAVYFIFRGKIRTESGYRRDHVTRWRVFSMSWTD
jgi:cytochrome d ubiquinol oxidase subunit II